MFFKVLDYCCQNSSGGGYSWWLQRRWRRWLWKCRNKPFFSKPAVHSLKILKMPAHFRIFFQSCSSWGIADDEDFLWESALEYGGDPNESRPQLRGLHLQHPSSLPQFSPKGLSLTQKVFFVVLKHLLKRRVRWRTFGTGKNTVMIGSSLGIEGSIRILQEGNFFSDKCFKQRERIGKENVHCL